MRWPRSTACAAARRWSRHSGSRPNCSSSPQYFAASQT
jgi:hypothetical protein